MADEVKVKFGGDFTDVPKGADAAAKQAGTAIANSFSDAASKASKMFLGAFAVSSIVSSIYSGMREAGQYFIELQNTMKKTGASSQDLQMLGKAGKESGVGIESIGNALVKTNKFLNEATKGGESQLETLRSLGFATDQASVANIKAIDIFYKLADEIKRTGDATKYTETIIKIFGKSGAELIPVLSKGSDELKELAESSKLYTEAEIKAGAAAEKAAKAAERAWNDLYRTLTAGLGEGYLKTKIGDAIEAGIQQSGAKGTAATLSRFGTEATPEQQESAAKYIIKQGRKLGLTTQETLDYFEKEQSDVFARISGFSEATGAKLRARIMEEIRKEKEKGGTDTGAVETLTAVGKSNAVVSSLQAIGAGDIQSIFAGTYQDQMLDAQQRTATATEQVAQNTNPNNPPPSEPPAKAGH